jgi:hypothetical protein
MVAGEEALSTGVPAGDGIGKGWFGADCNIIAVSSSAVSFSMTGGGLAEEAGATVGRGVVITGGGPPPMLGDEYLLVLS